MIEAVFEVSGSRFYLKHIMADDSRSVVNRDGETVLIYTSSTEVRSGDKKKQFGYLRSKGLYYIFEPSSGLDDIFQTGIPHRDWHFDALVEAEVAVAKHLIQRYSL